MDQHDPMSKMEFFLDYLTIAMLLCECVSVCGVIYACCVVVSMLVVWWGLCLLCGGVYACCVVESMLVVWWGLFFLCMELKVIKVTTETFWY